MKKYFFLIQATFFIIVEIFPFYSYLYGYRTNSWIYDEIHSNVDYMQNDLRDIGDQQQKIQDVMIKKNEKEIEDKQYREKVFDCINESTTSITSEVNSIIKEKELKKKITWENVAVGVIGFMIALTGYKIIFCSNSFK